ncbi:hypothetical protein FA13DRAFT_1740183 [Coprinellus micaceus]|jgi:hypothetical protein|uniref:Uncharacterized protein n=1 Tax=Coprinellus micaceus TaxID=71717 RepID=A0A4Y7SMV7_COPMI|nr:hypothetical protein FA13DRAFT_1740183 [Coprinellus micaceus]
MVPSASLYEWVCNQGTGLTSSVTTKDEEWRTEGRIEEGWKKEKKEKPATKAVAAKRGRV